MMRRTLEIRTVVALAAVGVTSVGFLAAAGCTQQERTTTAQSAAQVAAATVTTTATGQSTTTTPTRRSTGVKLNGRGGFDASEAQKTALARAHYLRDHHNDVFKPFRPSTQPTSQPTTTTATGR